MADIVVGLSLPGDEGVVWFEVEDDRWVPAGAGDRPLVGRFEDALRPLVAGARMVVDQVRSLAADEVEVEFGAKLAGETGWIFAKASTEGNMKVTLRWSTAEAPSQQNP